MTWDRVEEQWGKLTDDDLTQINVSREQLEGKIKPGTVTPRIRCRRRSTTG